MEDEQQTAISSGSSNPLLYIHYEGLITTEYRTRGASADIPHKRNHWRIKGGARDARPPGGPNSFIFMQFLATI